MNKNALLLAQTLALAVRQRVRRRLKIPRVGHVITPSASRSPSQRIGDRYEQTAARWLQAQGLVLLARHLCTRHGEIDLAMREGSLLVFVEVRARNTRHFGGAAASIGQAKQQRIILAAAHWLPKLAQRYWAGRLPAVRFDVVTFDAGHPQWLRAAFEAC